MGIRRLRQGYTVVVEIVHIFNQGFKGARLALDLIRNMLNLFPIIVVLLKKRIQFKALVLIFRYISLPSFEYFLVKRT